MRRFLLGCSVFVLVGAGAALGAARSNGATVGSDLTLVSPKGALASGQTFTIVLHSDTLTEQIRLESDLGQSHKPVVAAPDASGDYRFAEDVGTTEGGGSYTFEAYPADQADAPGTLLLKFTLGVEPKLYSMQAVHDRRSTLMAPGCTVCVIRDPRGDTHGGPPDISSFSVSYKAGWVSAKIVTYDFAASGYGSRPCVNGWAQNVQFTVGCFGGPHYGQVFGNRACVHPDSAGDCGSAHMSVGAHVTSYRFPVSVLRRTNQLPLQVWVVYPGDRLMDTVPNAVNLGQRSGLDCYVVLQVKKGTPRNYSFGKSLCSQAGTVVAKP
jgi:hypothetical protein